MTNTFNISNVLRTLDVASLEIDIHCESHSKGIVYLEIKEIRVNDFVEYSERHVATIPGKEAEHTLTDEALELISNAVESMYLQTRLHVSNLLSDEMTLILCRYRDPELMTTMAKTPNQR